MTPINPEHDEMLIAKLRKGDGDAYVALYERHWDNAFRMIYSRIGDKLVAEEMTQEIFMKLWDKRTGLSINNFSAYLYTTVKNKCVNYIEARITKRKFWKYYETFLPRQEDQTDRMVDFNELTRALDEGLNSIPAKSKLVFTLSRLEGYSIKEIAGKLKLSEKAIQYHLTRSVKELRVYLKDFIVAVLLWLS